MGSIRLEKVSKHFGEHAVIPSIDLEINEGEFVVFVGPSGCGKSTLLRLIAGLEDVTSGRILIDGEDATDKPPAKRGLAMVFQSYALYPHMSVRNNIGFPLKMANVDKAEIDRKVEDAAKILNLTDYLERKPRALSGGQRQRVAMGRAVVRDPAVFLFDEPLSNLDAKLRVQMRAEIKTLHQRVETTSVYVTHDQIEAMTLADRVVVLNQGRIEQQGTPIELYRKPANLFVAAFIGSPAMNLLPGTIVAADGAPAVRFADGTVLAISGDHAGLTPGRKVTVGLRPEHLNPDIGTGSVINGTALLVEPTGAQSHVVFELGGQHVTAIVDGEREVRHGQPFEAKIDPERVHIFDSETGEAL